MGDDHSNRSERKRAASHNASAVWDGLATLGRGLAPAGQRLATNSGLRAISEIAPGDEVLTYDADHQISVLRTVRRILALAPEPIWEIGFADEAILSAGRRFRSTGHHPLLTARGWRRVAKLQPGDVVLSADADGERMRAQIASVRPTTAVEPVYAIAVDGRAPIVIERLVAKGGVARSTWMMMSPRLRPVREIAPRGAFASGRYAFV